MGCGSTLPKVIPGGINTPIISSFVYQPGGTAGGNVYTSWSNLISALDSSTGFRYLLFDDTFSSISIPAGTYDMQDVVWTGPPERSSFLFLNQLTVTILEGVILTNFRAIENFLLIDFTGSTPPVSDWVGIFDVFRIRSGAAIRCSGSGPFFRSTVAGGTAYPVIALHTGRLLNNGNAVFDMTNVSGAGLIRVETTSTLGANTISGVAGSACGIQVEGGRNYISWTHTGMSGTIVPSFLGAQYKSGEVAAASFASVSGEMRATVTFSNYPYANALYSPNLSFEANNLATFIPRVVSQTSSNFVIGLGTNDKTDLVKVMWSIQGGHVVASDI